jgi:5'-3' exonuclease
VREKFGVDPSQITDYLGLIGDTVDNLPGVPGVGPKGASAALCAFGRIEDIPADAAKWEGLAVRGARRIAGLVDEHRELALRTRGLATLVRDVPGLAGGLRALQWKLRDHTVAEALFESFGWDRIATRIPRQG